MQKGYKPTYRRSAGHGRGASLRAAVVVLALCIVGAGVYAFVSTSAAAPDNAEATDASQPQGEQRASFVAVGDNLPDDLLGSYADSLAGDMGDGLYDWHPLYTAIKPYITAADFAYVNFETPAGGDDIGPKGYPSFNTTDTEVDAVFDTGFNLIASATNHSYDWGWDALVHSVTLWQSKPVLYVGMATTPEDAYTIHTYEKNGITVSLLDYTYGINGYDESDIPDYAVNYMHEDRIRADIAAARQVSDFVIVAMHWGTENQTDPDANQVYYAQLIADAGADLVLGSHPHVIGPLAWVQGAGGNETLVAYSLGNFLSRHEEPAPMNELEGMLQCDFVKDASGTRIENVRWVPLVNHTEEGNYGMYALKDFTPELAARDSVLAGLDDPIGWLKQQTLAVIGPDFVIDD